MTEYDRGVLDGQESVDRELDACKDRLERVEKERDKWSSHWEAEHEQNVALQASMDRARELALAGVVAYGELSDVGKQFSALHCLLSGGEKPHPGLGIEDCL